MKRLLLTIALPLTLIVIGRAQSVRLNGYGAYVFDDKFDTYYSNTDYIEGKVKGGFQWGVGVEVKVRPDMGAELVYLRQDTEAPISYYNLGAQNRTLDLGINYIMIGGNRYFKPDQKVEPYGGFMLGAVIVSNKNPKGSEDDSAVKFAWGLRLGTNIWASDKVGLKIYAQLLSAVQGMGGGLYVGTGGAGAGVSSYSTMYQFGFGGGLTFKLKSEE